MTPTAGLSTAIWNNNLRSIFLLVMYPLILMATMWLIAYVVASSQGGYHMERYEQPDGTLWLNTGNPEYVANNILYQFWPLILTGVAIWFLVSWFFHTSMIRKLSHSRPVTRAEEPGLYNILENLCISRGITMPRLEIIETEALNAFASGIDEKSYAITVTRGLMNRLAPDEMEAVLGHELTHILNRDVRLLIVCVVFTGMFGFAAQMVWNSLRFGAYRSRNQRGNGVVLLLAIGAILWLGYMATLLMRFAISRRREYMADAGSIELTKNPEAMMRALMKISGQDRIPETTEDIRMMCTHNGHAFMGLFATHPPIEARVKAIAAMTGMEAPGDISHAISHGRRNPWG